MNSVLRSCAQTDAHGRYHTTNRPGFAKKPGLVNPNVTCAPVVRTWCDRPATAHHKRILARYGNRSPAEEPRPTGCTSV